MSYGNENAARILFASIPDENTGGDCFETAFRNQQDDPSLLVCHGVVHGQGALEGYVFPHAWNETRDGLLVVDTSNGNDLTLPRDLYYSIGRIDGSRVRRYTCDEVLDEILSLGHYGPWDSELDFSYRAAFSTAVRGFDESVICECARCGKLAEADAKSGLCRSCHERGMFSDLMSSAPDDIGGIARYSPSDIASMLGETEFRYMDEYDLAVWNGHRASIDKESAWKDVKRKGEAILAAGGVEIISESPVEVVALVMSGELDANEEFDVTDGGPYEVTLSKKSWENSENVGGWVQAFFCDCAYGQYNSGSVGPNMQGRLCSHAYAALLASGQRARKEMTNDRSAMRKTESVLTWEHEIDEYDGSDWWFASAHCDGADFDLSIVQASENAWDSYRWEVWEAGDDSAPVDGGGESTLEAAMDEAEASVLESFGKRASMQATRSTNIHDWYTENFPTDDLGYKIDPDIDFGGLLDMMANGMDFYDIVGVGDSLIRERVFYDGCIEAWGWNGDEIYDFWLHGALPEFAASRKGAKAASRKNATRKFTYAEIKELEDEIEGTELRNADRLKDSAPDFG